MGSRRKRPATDRGPGGCLPIDSPVARGRDPGDVQRWILPESQGEGRELAPPSRCPDRGLLLVAEAATTSPVVEEREEHDQVDDRGGGQVDGQPLLPLAAVSGFCLSHCPPPSSASDRFTGST